MANIYRHSNPKLFDKVFSQMQDNLSEGLSWLDNCFPKAERLVKIINGKRIYTPNYYLGNNEYELILPDSGLGNFSFFTLDEPQNTEYKVWGRTTLKAPFSLIVWVDMRRMNDGDERNTDAVKQEILQVLNGDFRILEGHYQINRIYEKAENVFDGFTLDEVDNQFLMHPFCGWRFTGEAIIKTDCVESVVDNNNNNENEGNDDK